MNLSDLGTIIHGESLVNSSKVREFASLRLFKDKGIELIYENRVWKPLTVFTIRSFQQSNFGVCTIDEQNPIV